METIHPIIVHFPIALLLTATFISVLAVIFKNKREELKIVLYWILILGAISALAALSSGLYESERVIHDEAIRQIMKVHKFLGFVIASAFVLITVWFIIRKRKIQFRELLIITLFLIGTSSVLVYSAYLGGKMVYEEGAGVKPMEKLIMEMPGGSLYHHEEGTIHNTGEQVEHEHPGMKKGANSPQDSTDSHEHSHNADVHLH